MADSPKWNERERLQTHCPTENCLPLATATLFREIIHYGLLNHLHYLHQHCRNAYAQHTLEYLTVKANFVYAHIFALGDKIPKCYYGLQYLRYYGGKRRPLTPLSDGFIIFIITGSRTMLVIAISPTISMARFNMPYAYYHVSRLRNIYKCRTDKHYS